ncbi:MAG: MFS transporter [Opitutales bacterium]|nr:MFS transporter [Opitutales bacterium]
MLFNIFFNILLPVIILSKGGRFVESPAVVMIVALSFPICYFFYDLRRRGKYNFFSIIGFVSVLLTGGVGLLALPRFWFIVKEAAIPFIFGLAVIISLKTRYPLIRTLFFNPQIFDVERLKANLRERQNEAAFERLLFNGTLLLSVTFFISAGLNWILASHIIQTEPSVDAAQFNIEVGKMTGWSWLIIALPSMIMLMGIFFYLIRGATRMTGLKMDDLLAAEHRSAVEKN